MEPFKDHLSTRGCLTSLKNKSQQNQPGKLLAPIPPELLVNEYSYHLMVKCVLLLHVWKPTFLRSSHIYIRKCGSKMYDMCSPIPLLHM